MTASGWFPRFKSALKPWVPARFLAFYRQFREPLRLPDRSEVVLFAPSGVLPDYRPRRDIAASLAGNAPRESVTLIATVYNEVETIARWLDSVLAQSRPPDEIVIADGGSTDGTLDVLRRYARSSPVPMQVIPAPGANIARGRNLAIAAASHEIIACSDCGSLLDVNWLEMLTLPFALDPEISVSAGYYEVLETNTLSRLAKRFFGVDLERIDPQTFLPSGRSLAFRKPLWEDAGGYPEWLTDAGEDTLFDLRLKAQPARWAFVPSARVAWYAPDTLGKLIKTYFRYSRGDGETGISAELYWYKVVELLRTWPRRMAFLAVGLMVLILQPLFGALYFGGWLLWGGWRLWRDNRLYAETLERRFYPYSVLLEIVGTVQAFAFTLGVFSRKRVRNREIAFYQARLHEILERYPDRRGLIVYPPTHDWSFMFQRPHQMARALARRGWLYFYCTRNGRSDAVFGFRQVEPGLFVAHVPQETFRVLERPVVYLGAAWNISWLPYFDAPRVVYDHYDDLEVSGARRDDHLALLRNAEVVIVTARRLLDAVQPYREDALLIPNGVDYAFIRAARPGEGDAPPPDLLPLLDLARPIIGYSGALAEWFDYDLLKQAARQYPAFSFVLIGVDYDGSLERSGALNLPNVFYLGMKDYADLFAYVWRFDVATIPFKVNEITLATSPVKLFEYMACRKPVVTTDLPECRSYEGIFLAKNAPQFVDYLADAMRKRNDEAYLERIAEIARANTWDARVRILDERLSHPHEKQSA